MPDTLIEFAGPRIFWLHMHKNKSRAEKKVWWTVHVAGKCHHVNTVVVKVPTWTVAKKVRADGSFPQPWAVVKGRIGAIRIHEVDGDLTAVLARDVKGTKNPNITTNG